MAKKRRLTGAIRDDIHTHVRRESGVGKRVNDALQDFREYVVKCWIDWADVAYKAAKEITLPDACFRKAGTNETVDFFKFYADTGSWEYPEKYTSVILGELSIIRGTNCNQFHSRHLTKPQIAEIKRLGRAWDAAREAAAVLNRDLGSVLSSNTTVEGLISDFPQCEQFAKQFLNPEKDQQTSLVVPGAHARIRKALRAGATS